MGCFSYYFLFLDFIKSLDTTMQVAYVDLNIEGNVADWSGLQGKNVYQAIRLKSKNGKSGNLGEYLKDVKVNEMSLTGFKDLDPSQLPTEVYHELEISQCNLKDFSGLGKLITSSIILTDLDELESLNGLDSAAEDRRIQLTIAGCPRLTDWSALATMQLDKLTLSRTKMIPEFSNVHTNSLRLEYIDWMDDRKAPKGLDASGNYGSIELVGLPKMRNLMWLRKVHGDRLVVQPDLENQAQALVGSRNFNYYETEFPDYSWKVQEEEKITIKDLADLDTLAPGALKDLKGFTLVGDKIVDGQQVVIIENPNGYFLHDNQTGKDRQVELGTMNDLTKMAEMTGLKELNLISQQIRSLEGLENMLDLEEIYIRDCPGLEDISVLFTLENLRVIRIDNTPVKSIQGVQNLSKLEELSMHGTRVTDKSPAADLDSTVKVTIEP